MLDRHSRQLNIFVLAAERIERANAVANTRNVLVGQHACLDVSAAERTRHYHERPVTALRSLFAKLLVKTDKLTQRTSAADLHELLIIDRTFLGKPVRTVSLQFVRKIAAGNVYRTPAQLFGSPAYSLSEAEMRSERQP